MMKFFKSINPFTKPSPEMMAVRELEEARRSLLEAQTAKEYAASIEQYNKARITRLQEYLAQSTQ